MATPFPTDLVAAPAGGRIAWVSSNSGVHNILVADPTPGSPADRFMAGRTDHKWRAVTTYQGDDGLWITDLNWTSDGKTIVYVRGDGANRQGENPTPRSCKTAPSRQCSRSALTEGHRNGSGSAMDRCRHRVGNEWRGCSAVKSGAPISDPPKRRRGSSTPAALPPVLPGRPTGRCSRSRATAARTAISVYLRSRLESCAISIRHSIATAALRGRPTGPGSRGSARAPRRGRACFHRAARSTSRGRCAWPM